MKTVLRIAGAAAALWLGAGCAAPRGRLADGSIGPDLRLYAQGLSCPLCAHNLDAQLQRVPGVARAAIDLGEGRANVWFEPGASPDLERIARAVSDSGFTLDRIEGP